MRFRGPLMILTGARRDISLNSLKQNGIRSIILRKISNQGGDDKKDEVVKQAFDTKMLDFLACPLTKQPLRYDENAQELVNDSIGVAYRINNGIPNLVPQDARRFQLTEEKFCIKSWC